MPLFGKNKKEKEKVQQAHNAALAQPPAPSNYPEPPPAYSTLYDPNTPGSSQPQQPGYPLAQQQQYPYQQQQAPGYGQPNYNPPPQQQQQYYQAPPPTVMVQGGFDAGARFGAGAQPNVPPPPPGCMPNAAQMAMMQGNQLVVTQQKGNFMTGGSDGGYTWGGLF